MKLTQLFSILFIISSICVASIKPENSKKIESIQITNQSNTKFTYYHLKNKGEIIFENLDRILKKDKNYIIGELKSAIKEVEVAIKDLADESPGFLTNYGDL